MKSGAKFSGLLLVMMVINSYSAHSQGTSIRGDMAITKSRFVGGDFKVMRDNSSWAAGVLVEHGSGIYEDHGRWHYGFRVRHLQAAQDVYASDSLGQLIAGNESYHYNYLEFPLGVEFDLLAGSNNYFNVGVSTDVFGAVPFGVKGNRDFVGANPWSADYETPYFILGFGLSGYVGINIRPVGVKVHYMGQFPFIPIVKSAPSSYTGPAYKPQLLGTRGLMISVTYILEE